MLAALILAVQTPVPVPVAVATPEDEIVVIGQKLRSAKFRYAAKGGKLRSCRATTRGVDPVIATAGCEAIGQCAADGRAGRADIGACIAERRPAIRDRIAELRAAR